MTHEVLAELGIFQTAEENFLRGGSCWHFSAALWDAVEKLEPDSAWRFMVMG